MQADKGEPATNEWGGAGVVSAAAKVSATGGGVKIKLQLKKEKTEKEKKAKKEKKDRKVRSFVRR